MNDWESDLSSIIEKTNQNLKLLRRIGDKRSDLSGSGAYDVSTTSTRPATATSAAQIASDMRSFASSISNRYAAEDGASSRTRGMSTTGIPRATTSTTATSSSSKKLHRSSSMGVENARERARESLIIRPATTVAFGSDGEGDAEMSEGRSPRRSTSRPSQSGVSMTSATRASGSSSSGAIKRSSSVATSKTRSGTTSASSSRMSAATSSGVASGNNNYSNHHGGGVTGNEMAAEELRKSLEVHIASRSSAFEMALADLRTDMTVVSTETNGLAIKMHELRDAVTAKLSSVASTTQSVVEHGESIGRLEKHSAVLLGWKVGVDQDLFEISSKLKSFASIQEKMTSLESHLEALGTAVKNAHRTARYDEKIDELRDRVAVMERQAAHQLDAKAVEHTVQMRVSKEINELENRFQQSLLFLTQKLENKIQTLEKTVQSDRIDAIASLKSELIDDIDKLESKTLKKPEMVPFQNAQTQIKDDIAHMQLFFERQDKRFHELKQNSTQMRDELVETRHELTKALHAQQNRVSTTLEEKVAQLAVLAKDKNTKADQKIALLEKRHKKIEDQTKSLYDAVEKVKHDAVSRRAVDTVTQQRENEKLRQRLTRSIAELEQLHTAKQELERSMEAQDRQYQAKINDLRHQVDEQEKTKETQRTELLQAIQHESKQMGFAQGRNALLESLLAREKLESEEKTQQIHKARQEIAQIRQKMRVLESDVDKKMQKLSTELLSKQTQVDTLVKKLKRSEDDALKLVEAAKREKKSLARTKEIKQQELVVAKIKLKELEKVVTTVAAVKEAEGNAAQQHVDQAARLADVESKRKQLEELLTDRQLEVQEMRLELQEMKMERDELVKTQEETMSVKVQVLAAEYESTIETFEREIAAKDAQMKQLRETLVDRSELLALDDALAQLRSEKESLVEQLKVSEAEYDRRVVATESSLHSLHASELHTLQSKMEERGAEIGALQTTLAETREKLDGLEETLKQTATTHAQESTRLVHELKEARAEVERLILETSDLEAAKKKVEGEVQAALEVASAESDEQQDEVDRLRQNCEELSSERQRLSQELKTKSDELEELTKLDTHHQERLAAVMKEQDEMRLQLEQEIDSLRQTLEQERAASTECARELKATIDTLEDELTTERRHALDGANGTSKLERELQSVVDQLTTAAAAETAMKTKLEGVLSELSTLANVPLSDCASSDPTSVLRKCMSSMADTHASELARLAADHEDAIKRAASDGVRVQALETQIQELTSQIQELDDVNRELKADMESLCAEKARQLLEMGRLQDEITVMRDQKHALEEQVEEQVAQYGELEVNLSDQIHDKDAEVEELKQVNAGLEKTITDIHETIERIESTKIAELDGLSMELQDLELQLLSLTSKPSSGGSHDAAMEKEFFVNQQAIAHAGQQIRALFSKLCSGCSVVELQELKSALTAMETKHARHRDDMQRDRQRCVEAEEQVLLNVEFLEALMTESSGGADGRHHTLADKYVMAAPNLASQLSRLQGLFHDALRQCSEEAAASLTKANLTIREETVSSSDALNEGNGGDHDGDDDTKLEDAMDDEEDELVVEDEDENASESSAQDLEESTSELETSHADDSLATNTELDCEHAAEEDDRSDCEESVAEDEEESRPGASLSTSASLTISLEHVSTARADACTALIQSPVTALLQEPFQGFRAKSDRGVDQVDDASVRAESCTTLLHSPTSALLHEPLKPAPLGGRYDDDAIDSDNDELADDDEAERDVSVSRGEVSSVRPPSSSDRHHDESVYHGQSELHGSEEEQSDDDDDLQRSSDDYDEQDNMTSREETISVAGRHLVSPNTVRDQAESDHLDASHVSNEQDEEDDELIDSGSEADGTEQDGEDKAEEEEEIDERHDVDARDDADGCAAMDVGHDDEDELSQSLESMIRMTAGEESMDVAGARAVHRAHGHNGLLHDEEGSDEDLSDDEDHDLEEDELEQQTESVTRVGANALREQADREFSDDGDADEASGQASMEGDCGISAEESTIPEAHCDSSAARASVSDNRDSRVRDDDDDEESADDGECEDAEPPRRVDPLESAASDFDGQLHDEGESADEMMEASMDSSMEEPMPFNLRNSHADTGDSFSSATVSAAPPRLSAALRKDSDDDDHELRAAEFNLSARGQRNDNEDGDDDDEFDEIDEHDHQSEEEADLSCDGSSINGDSPSKSATQESTVDGGVAASLGTSADTPSIETVACREEADAVLGGGSAVVEHNPPVPGPLSALQKGINGDEEDEELQVASLSVMSSVSRPLETNDDDHEFDHDDQDLSEVDETEDDHHERDNSSMDGSQELDGSQQLYAEKTQARLDGLTSLASSARPEEGAFVSSVLPTRLAALRNHSDDDGDDDEELRASQQLTMQSHRSGLNHDAEDHEFGHSDHEESLDAGSDQEDDLDASQDEEQPPLASLTAPSSSSFGSTPHRIGTEDKDEFGAARTAMDSMGGRKEVEDDSGDEDEESHEVSAHDLDVSDHDEDEHHHAESDLGDMDASQDFGDEMALPSFDDRSTSATGAPTSVESTSRRRDERDEDAPVETNVSDTEDDGDHEPQSASSGSSSNPLGGIAALRKDSSEDDLPAASFSVISPVSDLNKKDDDEFDDEIDDDDEDEQAASNDFDDIDSSQELSSESTRSPPIAVVLPPTALRKDSAAEEEEEEEDELRGVRPATDLMRANHDEGNESDDEFGIHGDAAAAAAVHEPLGDSPVNRKNDEHASKMEDDCDDSCETASEKPTLQVGGMATAAVPLLPLGRLAALRKDSDDDDDEFQAAQLAMNSRTRGTADDTNDGDNEFDQEEEENSDAGAMDRRGAAAYSRNESAHDGEEDSASDFGDIDDSQDFGDDMALPSSVSKPPTGSDAVDARDVNDDREHERPAESPSTASQSLGRKEEKVHNARISVDSHVDHDGDADANHASDQVGSDDEGDGDERFAAHDSYSEIDEMETSLDEPNTLKMDPANPLADDKSTPPVASERTHEIRGRSDGGDHHDGDDDGDSDFDRVLSGDDDEDEDDRDGHHEFDQSSSFDTPDLDHLAVERHDDHNQQSDDQLNSKAQLSIEQDDAREDTSLRFDESARDDFGDDDSMDEVERLLLQHAEDTDDHSEKERQFTSSLRMDDEDDQEDQEEEGVEAEDELIDSDEEEEDDEEADIGADSMRSENENDSDGPVSPVVMTKQIHDTTADDDEDVDGMDAMEQLLQNAPESVQHVAKRDGDAEDDSEEDEATASPPKPADPAIASQASRAATKNFDDSDDDDEKEEVAAAPSPVHLPVPQLQPLSGSMSGRTRGAGGGGSLMKALQASRMTLGSGDDLDDDMDEVEQLMATQSFQQQRKPLPSVITAKQTAPVVASTLQNNATFDDDDFDQSDDDHDESPRGATVDTHAAEKDEEASEEMKSLPTQAHLDDQDDASEHEHDDDDDEDQLDDGMEDESGTFGSSFGDGELERALASPTTKPSVPSRSPLIAKLDNEIDNDGSGEDDDDDGDDRQRSGISGGAASQIQAAASLLTQGASGGRQLGALQPLSSLGRTPLPGLAGLGRTSRLALEEEDDDMDEVERLLLEQTSMKTTTMKSTTTAKLRHHSSDNDDEDEDAGEFEAASPLRNDADLPRAREDDDEFAHFDRDDDDDDGEGDGDGLDRRRDGRETSSGGLSDSHGSAASPSRIPILRGSTLLTKPLPLGSGAAAPTAAAAAGGATAPSPTTQRPRLASAQSDSDYMEDSFDLEESLQEEEEQVEEEAAEEYVG